MSAGPQNGPPYFPIRLTLVLSFISNPKRQPLSTVDIIHAPPTVSSIVPKISHLHTLPAVLPLPNFSILPAHTLKHSHKQIMSLLSSPFILLPQYRSPLKISDDIDSEIRNCESDGQVKR